MSKASTFHMPRRLALSAVALAAMAPSAQAQNVAAAVFNEQFLNVGGEQAHADLSLFSHGNRVLPGQYTVDVSVNGSRFGQSEVVFADKEGQQDATPCITRALLDEWGLNVAVFPSVATAADDACVDLSAIVPDSIVTYDGGKQRLVLSIPQAALKRAARDSVSPEKWDRGIDAAMLDYQFNYAKYDGDRFRDDRAFDIAPRSLFDASFDDRNRAGRRLERNTLFGGLRGGFNVGDWRFRHFSTYSRGLDGRGRWQGVSNYMQRDLPQIRGQLLVGDGSTPGNFFDSMPFRGVQISSDDAMLPNSLQGYAPTIRGVAQTNARISVRQNGYLVYSTYVAPGPFVLDDLYPTAASGDLEVTITEADGRETRYIQAFAAVPTLLREGAWRYSATAGEYRRGDYSRRNDYRRYDRYGQYDPWSDVRRKPFRPFFTQGTVARGLGDEFTLYGGATLSNNYQSLLSGVGRNLRDFGAVSLDMSYAHTFDRNNSATSVGHSLRFLYNKSFVESGTDFRLAGYRYSTSGYRTFEESARMQEPRSVRDLQDNFAINSRRNELRFEMAQRLGDWGSMYVSARQQSYWSAGGKDRLVQMGYSGFLKQVSYNIYYNYSSNLYSPSRRQIAVSLSIPLGGTRASAQYTASSDTRGRVSQRASVYGSALDDSRLTYNVTTGRTKEQGTDGSVNASYLSSVSRLDAGRSQGGGYGQTTLGVAGGVLVHGSGVTLSQPLGETIALVRAPKAEGVGIESRPGVSTDSAGHAVVPSLSPYRTNRLALRTEQLGDTVEVRNAAVDLVPTRGAVVLAKFETSVGFRLMMTLADKNGRPLPFGSKIENEAGQEVGIVGPDGQSFVTGAGNAGKLNVKWGRGETDQCSVAYSVPEEQNPPPIRELQGRCE